MWSGAQVTPPVPPSGASPPGGAGGAPPQQPSDPIPAIIAQINGLPPSSTAEGTIIDIIDWLADVISDRATLETVLDRIKAGITDPTYKQLFEKHATNKLTSIPNAPIAGGGARGSAMRRRQAQSEAQAQGGQQAKGGLSEEQRNKIYEIIEQQRSFGPGMQATRSEGENLASERGDARHQMQTAEGEERNARGYAQQAAKGLEDLKRQIGDSWNQLRLFGDQIAKKADNAELMMDMAIREAERWYMNYLWISMGNKSNDYGKILLFFFAMCQKIAWAGSGSGIGAAPLELGLLENVSQPPTESYNGALRAREDIKADQAKYDGEAEQLAGKERKDVPDRQAEVARYKQEEQEHRKEASFQSRLSDEAKRALALNKARGEGERKKYDDLERRKNEILREAGIDPQVG